MRYGNPSTASAVNDLIAQGCTRILALALYPQYSATTTASAYDKLFDALKRVKRQPALTTLGSYHDHPLYIDALAQSVRRALAWKEGTPAPSPHKPSEPQPQKLLPPQGGGWEGGIHGTSSAKTTARLLSHRERAEGEGSPPPTPAPLPPLLLDPNDPTLPETIVVSFHGLPQRYFEEGDPYHCHCMKTSRLLRESLGWPAERWATSFQSRFGPAKWLEPYTSDTILRLAREGKKHIAILSPGFASDCIETLEELNIGLREQFLHEGGERFTYIPCLNTDEAHIRLLKALVEEAL